MGLSFFVTLLSVLNPPHPLRLYLSLVGRTTAEANRLVARTALLTVPAPAGGRGAPPTVGVP
jgi:small neutral amino acid transporter SnatA (MarC family)